jgi:DNA (cytosine-5)-methyltransferase 1
MAAQLPMQDVVAAGYRRTRDGRQVLELRFDGVAGCLRTPEGGSSRQHVVFRKVGEDWETRLLTVRETARLMGAPDSYVLPGSYNDGYKAMGDAVAVPVTAWLARHLLTPLALCARQKGDFYAKVG